MQHTLKAPIVIAVIQRKGGVGKTTIMHHLAVGFCLAGYDVLAIEADDNPRLRAILEGMQTRGKTTDASQTTYGLLMQPQDGVGGFAHTIFLDRLWQDIPHVSAAKIDEVRAERNWTIPGSFQYVPGSEKIKEIEAQFAQRALHDDGAFRPAQQLAKAIQDAARQKIIFIDVPPSLTTIWSNIVYAATHVVIPVDFDFASPEDFERTFNAYRDAKAKGAQAQFLGAVLNKYNPRNIDHQDMMRAYTEQHEEMVVDDQGRERIVTVAPMIPVGKILGTIPLENELINRAARYNRTLHQYAPRGEAGTAMWRMTQQVMQTLELD